MNELQNDGIDKDFLRTVSVLYVEDQDDVREDLALFLSRRCARVDVARNGQEGLEKFKDGHQDVVVTDIRMPVMDGLEMINQIKKIRKETPVILLTAYNETDFFLRAIDIGIDRYVNKPAAPEKIARTVYQTALTRFQARELEKVREHFRQIVETSQEGICEVDIEGRITFLNQRMAAMLGYEMGEMRGRPWFDFVCPKTKSLVLACYRECFGDFLTPATSLKQPPNCLAICLRNGRGTSEMFDLKLICKDGSYIWTTLSVSQMLDGSGTPVGMLGMLTDITDRQKALARIQLLAQVFDSTAESIMIFDANKAILDVNTAFTATTGFTPREAIGRKHWLVRTKSRDKTAYQLMWDTLTTYGHWHGEVHGRRKNGEVYPQLLNMGVVRNNQGEISNYIGIFSDISDLKRSQEQIEYMATHDPLTGLPNRNLFYDRLQHSLDKASRSGAQLAVLFMDLDNFKTINDTLGHEMGDLLLTQMADRLRACTRKHDTIARMGGDEFTVLAEDLRASVEETVSATAERMIASLSLPFDLGGRETFISASVGVALYPKDGKHLETLLKNADTAMYQAKKRGKNNYQFFSQVMNAGASERAAIESGLRQALSRGEFFLVYQPQMQLDSKQVIGLEALLRWNHPERGVVLPDEFLRIAETTGLIVPMGDWVLQAVCGQIREWMQQGVPDLRVAVNLSARQFKEKALAGTIRRILDEHKVPASNLELELTESTVMNDPESAAATLQQLKDMGMRLAIEDFGTGYSSLQYLKHFLIDSLKIDSRFTRYIATDAADQAIATAIITMGHSMNMNVIAEGVETAQQFEFLRTQGCDMAQGYYIDQPLSVANATTAIHPA
jgi:diguanylate cyclase (GGDEF)-like protein/PAS domain S-box-containing protein